MNEMVIDEKMSPWREPMLGYHLRRIMRQKNDHYPPGRESSTCKGIGSPKSAHLNRPNTEYKNNV